MQRGRCRRVPTGEFLSYNPLHGDRIPQKTTVVAQLRRRLSVLRVQVRRSRAVGRSRRRSRGATTSGRTTGSGSASTRSGTGQLSYHMMVNASGVQLDMLNSAAGNEDSSPDWIWDSAGRLTDTGYIAEIRLPLQSIRFKGGADTRMGILFWRRVSRLGRVGVVAGARSRRWVFERHASLRFDDIAATPRARDAAERDLRRAPSCATTPTRWGAADGRSDFGFSAKVGLTSDDHARRDGQPRLQPGRERRVPGRGQPALPRLLRREAAVLHGRRRHLRARRRRRRRQHAAHGRSHAADRRSDFRRQAHGQRRTRHASARSRVTAVGRVRSGPDEATGSSTSAAPSTVSVRATTSARSTPDVDFAGRYNRVVGADLRWRVSDTAAARRDSCSRRNSRAARDDRHDARGIGAQVNYSYSTQKWGPSGRSSTTTKTSAMATAFINRVGITSGWGFVERNFYPDKKQLSLAPARHALRDFTQGGRDRARRRQRAPRGRRRAAVSFTRQGFLGVDQMFGYEHWRASDSSAAAPRAFGNVQLFRWLALDGGVGGGWQCSTTRSMPFQGRSTDVQRRPDAAAERPAVAVASLSARRVRSRRRPASASTRSTSSTRGPPTSSRARSRLRGIAQYDSSRQRVLTDFLSSYEPRPGTVVYAGYGSLLEQRDFVDGEWVPQRGRLPHHAARAVLQGVLSSIGSNKRGRLGSWE